MLVNFACWLKLKHTRPCVAEQRGGRGGGVRYHWFTHQPILPNTNISVHIYDKKQQFEGQNPKILESRRFGY